jgi:outer membrane protein assembly factor BamB
MKDAPGAYYASPVAGDGKVYLVSHAGKATVLSAAADAKWEIVSQHDFDEPVVATPAIAGGRIFLRTAKALYAFGTREPAGR